jgi:predicted nucleic acid-binding protein
MLEQILTYVGLVGVAILTFAFVGMTMHYERLLKKADKRFLDERHLRFELETDLWVTKALTGGKLQNAWNQLDAIERLLDEDEFLAREFVEIRIAEAKQALKGES